MSRKIKAMRWPMVLGSQGHASENEVAKQESSREKGRLGPAQEEKNFLSTLKVTVSKIHLLCPSQNVNASSYPSENLEQFCGSK